VEESGIEIVVIREYRCRLQFMFHRHYWTDLKQDAEIWCQGRSWPIRGLLVIVLAYMGVCHALDPDAGDMFYGITLAIHEAGHVIFRIFNNEPMMVAGGSITQLAGPIALGVSFLKQRDYFAIGVVGCWLSYSMYGMATYMADARAMILPLVSLDGSGTVIHDWNYLFSLWGVLSYDTTIAGVVRIFALVVLLASLGISVWCCWRMAISPKATTPNIIL
jgi:hypothetical protein